MVHNYTYTLEKLYNKDMRVKGYNFVNPFYGTIITQQLLESLVRDIQLRQAIEAGSRSRILESKLEPPNLEELVKYFTGKITSTKWVENIHLLQDKEFIRSLPKESQIELAEYTYKVFSKFYVKYIHRVKYQDYVEDIKKGEYGYMEFFTPVRELNKELKKRQDDRFQQDSKVRQLEEDKQYLVRDTNLEESFKHKEITTTKEIPKGELLGDLGGDTKSEEYDNYPIGQFRVRKDDDFRYELGIYGLDLEKPVNYKRIVGMYTPGIVISLVGFIGIYIASGAIPLLQAFLLLAFAVVMGSHILIRKKKNLKLVSRVEDLKLKYTINKEFRYLNGYDTSFKNTTNFLEDSNINGISKVVDFFNSPYKLEDGMPVRLYQLLYLDNGNVKITHSVRELTSEESYKEMLLPLKLTEEEFIQLYLNLKEEVKYEKEVKHYKNIVLSAKEDDTNYQKALEYSKEYHRLYENKKDTLGMNASIKKWEDITKEGKEEWDKQIKKNVEIIETALNEPNNK